MLSCEGILKEAEVLEALKQMKKKNEKKNGSAPGIDGITIDLFKVFWHHIEKLITTLFNTAF